MYEAFFGLKHKPFSLLPDPDFLFLSSKHSIALSLLEYSLTGQAGFCVITGDIGSGKTTLIRAFLGRIDRSFSVGLISNTHSGLTDISAWALNAFGQQPKSTNQADTYQELIAYLIAEYGAGRQCILIVDEAQNLSLEALEQFRLLSNINTGKDLLLQMVLVGQPELLEKLRRPELLQFAQRIAVSHHLTPLRFADSRRYIEHRLMVAGADRPIFSEMAIGAVQYFSGGVPRLINSICDLALVYAFADGVQTINEELVFRVVADRQSSGIAPFATGLSADDPTVRAAISDLTKSGAVAGPVAPSEVARSEVAPSEVAQSEVAPSEVAQTETAADQRTTQVAEPVVTVVEQAIVPAQESATAPMVATAPVRLTSTERGAQQIGKAGGDPAKPRTAAEVPAQREVAANRLETPARAAPAMTVAKKDVVVVADEAPRAAPPPPATPGLIGAGAPAKAKSADEAYFFGVEDDDLLLTMQVSNETPVPPAVSAARPVPVNERLQPAPSAADLAMVRSQSGPQPTWQRPAASFDSHPWPSIAKTNVAGAAPLTNSDQMAGTVTPVRRSWWRRSFSRAK